MMFKAAGKMLEWVPSPGLFEAEEGVACKRLITVRVNWCGDIMGKQLYFVD
jgi:hypothetical protein